MLIYTDLVREMIADIARTVPAFEHLRSGEIAVACAARWAGSAWGNLAYCMGLSILGEPTFTVWVRRRSRAIERVSPWFRRSSVKIHFQGTECRYLILFRMPRHLEHDPMETLVHELYHIGESFDGKLRPLRHGKVFDRRVRSLVDQWTRRGDARLTRLARLRLPELRDEFGTVLAHRLPGGFRHSIVEPVEAPSSYEEAAPRLYPGLNLAPRYSIEPMRFPPRRSPNRLTELDFVLRQYGPEGPSDLSAAMERYVRARSGASAWT